jgi:hypothetical protein
MTDLSTDEGDGGWKWYHVLLLAIFGVPVYLLGLPIFGIIVISGLSPGCSNLECRALYETLTTVPESLWVVATVLAFVLFILSFLTKVKSGLIGTVACSYRWAFILAPGVAGGEGFALPAPFFLGAIINLSVPSALPLPVYFLFVTWLVALPCVFIARHVRIPKWP